MNVVGESDGQPLFSLAYRGHYVVRQVHTTRYDITYMW